MLPDAYGCVVANRFGNLLDDEADPFDLISEVEKEKRRKKKKKEEDEKKSKQKKPGQRESQKDRRVPFAQEPQEPVPVRRPVQPARADVGERKPKKEEPPQEFSIPKPSFNTDTDFRGRVVRGRRAARGGAYSRTSDNMNLRGKREYDRHNGTGISPEEKRGGRGPWNWGCVEEAASELMEVSADTSVKSEDSQTTADAEKINRSGDEEDGEMVVQVAMEMTLDEWKALQEMGRPKAEFNIRKSENPIPSKAKVIHQSKHLETKSTVEDLEDEGNFLRRSVNDITSLLDINFGSLRRPSRGGRGRGGRGVATNRPERVKPLSDREDELAPDPDDPEDFPALSTGK
ncbi:intracellular hyaluronan-binding protein 4-like [Betta splendens]|uniref:Intracellular hyaluronan-binding protein 4-like n=1 Tax=Betta splendens TaxID=158456 RepID=A0A6P7NHB8_BETSP|nr:intracellular hyaluronan-binding protein 4-like [Betta splendens]